MERRGWGARGGWIERVDLSAFHGEPRGGRVGVGVDHTLPWRAEVGVGVDRALPWRAEVGVGVVRTLPWRVGAWSAEREWIWAPSMESRCLVGVVGGESGSRER
jgi:hypothetical protein